MLYAVLSSINPGSTLRLIWRNFKVFGHANVGLVDIIVRRLLNFAENFLIVGRGNTRVIFRPFFKRSCVWRENYFHAYLRFIEDFMCES